VGALDGSGDVLAGEFVGDVHQQALCLCEGLTIWRAEKSKGRTRLRMFVGRVGGKETTVEITGLISVKRVGIDECTPDGAGCFGYTEIYSSGRE
jgi:hypothetical protein